MQPFTHLAVGASVVVALPSPYGGPGSPRRYRVAAVLGREVTLRPEAGPIEPWPPAGAPCLIGSGAAAVRHESCEAVVVASSASMLIVEVVRDARRHVRFRVPCRARLEAPGTNLGVLEADVEDISMGGMRVRIPVLPPLDCRLFASVQVGDAPPILAISEVRGVHHGDEPGDLVVRLQFTVMAPSHQARLGALLEAPADEPTSRAVATAKTQACAVAKRYHDVTADAPRAQVVVRS